MRPIPGTLNSVILDRELEEKKKPSTSEPPRIRCPLCGWSPREADLWSCTSGNDLKSIIVTLLSAQAMTHWP